LTKDVGAPLLRKSLGGVIILRDVGPPSALVQYRFTPHRTEWAKHLQREMFKSLHYIAFTPL
jgi:hypothetical protein